MRDLSKTLLVAALVSAVAPVAPLAAATKGPSTANAGASPVTGDVRCLMAMFAVSQQKDQRQAAPGVFGIYYFTGRLSIRAPGLNLAEAMKAQAPTMGSQQIQAELQRCGPLFQTSVQGVQAGFQALQPAKPALGAAPPTPAPTAPATPSPVAPPPQPH